MGVKKSYICIIVITDYKIHNYITLGIRENGEVAMSWGERMRSHLKGSIAPDITISCFNIYMF